MEPGPLIALGVISFSQLECTEGTEMPPFSPTSVLVINIHRPRRRHRAAAAAGKSTQTVESSPLPQSWPTQPTCASVLLDTFTPNSSSRFDEEMPPQFNFVWLHENITSHHITLSNRMWFHEISLSYCQQINIAVGPGTPEPDLVIRTPWPSDDRRALHLPMVR